MKLRLLRRKVIVTLKNNRSVMGVLWARAFGVWTLQKASVESETGKMVPVDGEFIVLRENIQYVQVLP